MDAFEIFGNYALTIDNNIRFAPIVDINQLQLTIPIWNTISPSAIHQDNMKILHTVKLQLFILAVSIGKYN